MGTKYDSIEAKGIGKKDKAKLAAEYAARKDLPPRAQLGAGVVYTLPSGRFAGEKRAARIVDLTGHNTPAKTVFLEVSPSPRDGSSNELAPYHVSAHYDPKGAPGSFAFDFDGAKVTEETPAAPATAKKTKK